VLISPATAAGIADGSVTLAVRRWDRPRKGPGSTQRTAAGVIEVVTLDQADQADPAELTEDDAARAGVASLAELRRLLERRPGAHVDRMQVRTAGHDPRVALREQARAVGGGAAGTRPAAGPLGRRPAGRRLRREALRLVAARPGVRAPDLAASLGRETLPFRRDARRLEELRLTRSLPVGYEISPRGRAYLR
jgi:hypothetical protein